MEITMKKVLFAALVSSVVLLTSACETMQGLGKDVQKGGEKIEKSAK
jgi:predicted small secreted protein